MSKRLLSWLLAVCMLLSMLPLNAFAVEAEPVDEDTAAADTLDPAEPEPSDAPEESAREEAAQEDDLPSVQAELPEEETTVVEEPEETVVVQVPEETVTEEALLDPVEGGEIDAGDDPYAVTIQVSGITRMETDRDQWDDENERTWQRLDCYPDENVSVIIDGKTYNGYRQYGDDWSQTGNLNDVQADIQDDYPEAELFWTSGEDGENIWETGEHTATLYLRLPVEGQEEPYEVTQDYSVTVVPCPKIDLQVESTTALLETVEEDNDDGGAYFTVSTYPQRITVTLDNENELSGNVHDVERGLEQWYEDHDYPVPRITSYSIAPKVYQNKLEHGVPQVGDVLTATFYFCGIVREYKVTLVDRPEIALKAGSVTMFEGDNQDAWTWDNQHFYRLDCCTENATATVNGTEYHFSGRNDENPRDLVNKLQNDGIPVDDWSWDDDESPTNRWTARNAPYQARFALTYQGERVAECYYDVYVLENPIDHLEVPDIVRTTGQLSQARDEQGEWSRIDCNPDEVNVVLKNGDRLEHQNGWPGEQLRNSYIRDYPNLRVLWHWDSDETRDNPWAAGEGHDAWQVIAGVTAHYNVTVMEPPFDAARLTDDPNYTMKRLTNGASYIDCRPDDNQFVVLYKDGAEIARLLVGRPGDAAYDPNQYLGDYLESIGLHDYDWYWDSDESEENRWQVGTTHQAWLVVAGVESYPYNVKVIPAPFVWGEAYTLNDDGTEGEGCIARSLEDRRDHAVWDDDQGRLDYDNQQNLIDCWPGELRFRLYDENNALVFDGPIDAPEGEDETAGNSMRGWLRSLGLNDDIDWASGETEDEPWPEDFVGKAWLQVCNRRAADYLVDVVGNPIKSIEVEPFQLFSDDYQLNDNPTDAQNPYANREYNVEPPRIKVTTTNEQVYEGDFWDVKDRIEEDYNFHADWDWYHDMYQGTEPSLHAYVTVGRAEYPFAVELVDSHVQTVRVDNITRFFTDTFQERYWDEEQDEERWWDRIDCWPDYVEIAFNDGHDPISGNPDRVRDRLQEMYPDVRFGFIWESDETCDNRWTEPGEHDVDFYPCGEHGVSCTYKVNVINAVVRSVQVDAVTRYVDDREWLDHIGEEGYDPINCWPDRVTVTLLGSGEQISGTPDEVREELEKRTGARVQMDWWSTEGWKDENGTVPRYEAGQTYRSAAWFVVSGVESNRYDVNVVEIPVASIHVDDMTVLDTDRDKCEWEREDGTSYWWKHQSCWPDEISVTLKSGVQPVRDIPEDEWGIGTNEAGNVVLTGDTGHVEWLLREYYDYESRLRCITGEKPLVPGEDGSDGTWVARDEPYTAYCIMSWNDSQVEGQYNVTVIHSPIARIETDDIVRYESDRVESWDDDEQWFRLRTEPEEIRVFLEGNETETPDFTGSVDEAKDWLREHLKDSTVVSSNWDNDESRNNPFEAGNRYECRFSLGGCETTYQVDVREAPFESISVATVIRADTDTDHVRNDGGEYDRIDCWPDQVTVVMNVEPVQVIPQNVEGVSRDAQGRVTFTGDPNSLWDFLWEYYRFDAHMGWDNEENGTNRWTAGNTYQNGARFWLLDPIDEQDLTFGARYDVTVIQNPISNLTLGKIQRYNNERFHTEDWDEGEKHEYDRLDCYPGWVSFDLAMPDGTSKHFEGDFDELFGSDEVQAVMLPFRDTGVRYFWYWDTAERWDNPFEEGNTYGVRLCLFGLNASSEVEVISSPIASIDNIDVWKFTTDIHEEQAWGEDGPVFDDDGNPVMERRIDLYPGSITVKLIDKAPYNGKVYENVNFWDLERQMEADFPGIHISDHFDMGVNPDALWGPGNYVCNLRFCGFEKVYTIHVVQNTVSDVDISPATVIADADVTFPFRVWYEDENGEWVREDNYPLIVCEPEEMTIHFTDRDDITLTYNAEADGSFMEQAERAMTASMDYDFPVYWDSDQSPRNPWGLGMHKATLVVGDYRQEYDVQVVRNLDKLIAPVIPNQVFNGSPVVPDFRLMDGEQALVKDTDYTLAVENNTAVGQASYTITGKGNYVGTMTGTFRIAGASLEGAQVTVEPQTYTGAALEPVPTVTLNGKALTAGVDFAVTGYEDNTNAGQNTAKVTIIGKGSYAGTATGTFTIQPASLEKAVLTLDAAQLVFDGTAKTPAITAKLGDTDLTADDYTVSYSNNVNAGENTATVTITGKGNYTGTATKTFSIAPLAIQAAWVTAPDQTYTGQALTPVTVNRNGAALVSGTDYKVGYDDNENAGEVPFTVEGMGNYTGEVNGSFHIIPASLENATVTVGDQTYDGTEQEPDVTVMLGGVLLDDENYTVEYSDNVDAGTATATVIANDGGNVTGEITVSFTINPQSIAGAAVTAESMTYTGKALTPEATVELDDAALTEGEDYTVRYTNNTKAGKATVTVTGQGNYTGTASGAFTIKKANQSMTITAPESVLKGKTAQIKVRNAFGKLTYTTSNKIIATVSSGKVKGNKFGSVTITVKAAGDANHNAATQKVKIKVYEVATPGLPTVKAEANGISITGKTGTAAKYRIMYRTGTGNWKKLVDVAKPKTGKTFTYLWKSAKNNTKYTFSICCLNGSTQISDYNRTGKSIHFMTPPTLKNTAKGQVKATWKKVANVTGYEIMYATNANFTANKKTVKITKAATANTVVKNLIKGKTYYFRIRTYTTVKGKTTYSDWSGGRTIKLTK